MPKKQTLRCAYKDCQKVLEARVGPGIALSRRDNKSAVCSECGTKEALLPTAMAAKEFTPN